MGYTNGADDLVFKWLPATVSIPDADRGAEGPDGVRKDSLALAGEPAENGDLTAAGGGRLVTVAASVEVEDRLGDTILAEGWELAAYRRNPVVLWAHQHLSPPIGRSVRTWVGDGRLMATVEFAPTPFAQEIASLYERGFLSGVSVGFRALESERRRDGKRGVIFKRQELLEISAAPVPLNSDALAVRSRSVGDCDHLDGDDSEVAVAEVLTGLGRLWKELAQAV